MFLFLLYQSYRPKSCGARKVTFDVHLYSKIMTVCGGNSVDSSNEFQVSEELVYNELGTKFVGHQTIGTYKAALMKEYYHQVSEGTNRMDISAIEKSVAINSLIKTVKARQVVLDKRNCKEKHSTEILGYKIVSFLL